MMGVALQKIVDFLNPIAFILTGYYLFDLIIISISFSVKDILKLNDYTSFIVSGVVLFYWVSRYIMDRRREKEEKKLRDLKRDILERRNKREELEEDIEHLFNNDKQ